MKKIIIFVFLSLSFTINAFQVEPFIQFMEPIGKNANSVFKITNTTDNPLPIETELLRSQLNNNNIETTNESDDFFIMPPQTIIQPNNSQIFRVRYLGDTTISKSQPYRILFKQLLLNKEKDKGSHVEVLFNFSALVLLSPINSKEELSMTISSTNEQYTVDVNNSGNKYSDLSQKKLKIKGEKKEVILDWQDFSNITNFQFILPGRDKSFMITSKMFPNIGVIKTVNFVPM
jgi:P pilus assembly chaperone PapD